MRKIDAIFRRSSDSDSDTRLTLVPPTSPPVSVVTVNRSSSVTSESDYLARVNAPGTGPVITPETSFLVSTLEETCYASPFLNTESVADISIDLEERGMVAVPEVEAVVVMSSREELEED